MTESGAYWCHRISTFAVIGVLVWLYLRPLEGDDAGGKAPASGETQAATGVARDTQEKGS